jgi:deoxycytidylate deaminase
MVSCSKRCVHAEMRAIRTNARGADVVHVKIDEHGELVAGGGPSCWQCSREILDAGCKGAWLYEQSQPGDCWRYYTAADFHRTTMLACDIHNPEAR